MSKAPRLVAGAAVSALIIAACSSSGSSGSTSTGDATPPGTTPVTTAPYPVCTPLESGSFVTKNDASFPVPSTTSCSPAGKPTPGAADMHCVGVTPQVVNGASCDVMASGTGGSAGSSGSSSSGSSGSSSSGSSGSSGSSSSGSSSGGTGGSMTAPTPGPCDENGTDGAYGSTMYGTEGNDDDCKYHVTYSVSPLCENNGTYFVVTATKLAGDMGVLTGASTFAEICLNDTHPAPAIDARPPGGNQEVVEGPPGTYTIGPVQFDAPGDWTVRFHFNEFCCDIADDSPHGHAAFHVTVP